MLKQSDGKSLRWDSAALLVSLDRASCQRAATRPDEQAGRARFVVISASADFAAKQATQDTANDRAGRSGMTLAMIEAPILFLIVPAPFVARSVSIALAIISTFVAIVSIVALIAGPIVAVRVRCCWNCGGADAGDGDSNSQVHEFRQHGDLLHVLLWSQIADTAVIQV